MTRLKGVWFLGLAGMASCLLLAYTGAGSGQTTLTKKAAKPASPPSSDRYAGVIRPLVQKYCLACHSTQAKRGGLDLQRFTITAEVRKDLKPWQGVIEHLDVGDMPPKGMPQPTSAEKQQILAWTRGFLDAAARTEAGDPGYVPLRRLSNAEYNHTIRDLTGVDLQPTREFPADGAAGEGFTNAAEALTEVSPTLLTKYFNAAKDVSDHAVLLPEGFRFSGAKNRRDWTDESTARLRAFYAGVVGPDGKIPFTPYLAATIRNRAALTSGATIPEAVAAKEKLNPKYLHILWQTLNDKTPSAPLDAIRARWRQAGEADTPALAAEIAAWQGVLWREVRVGSYMRPVGNGYAESVSRQVANDPVPVASQTLRLAVKPTPGQNDVTLYLSAREWTKAGPGQVVWHQPRLESKGKPPLLLRDYAQYGPKYEVDYPAVFADSSRYLGAAVEAANEPQQTVEGLAQKHRLNAALLQRWISTLNVRPYSKEAVAENSGRPVPAVALELLEEKLGKDNNRPAISGWKKRGTDLPALITNASDTVEHIPGTASPHGVMVHPTPMEFVAVAWKSPVSGTIRLRANILHAHPACGNGVAWWLEQRHGEQALQFAEGTLELGQQARVGVKTRRVEKGDLIVLAVDAKNGDHGCDLTDISLNITSADQPERVWDLAKDIADNVLDGNPHSDRYGDRDAWLFVKGPTRPVNASAAPIIPPDSVLGRWQAAAANPDRKAEAAQLAEQAQRLLSGGTPKESDSDRTLYDNLVSAAGPLFTGIDPATLAKPKPGAVVYGLAKERFGRPNGGNPAEAADLLTPADKVISFRLPAALLQGREFVVEGTLDGPSENRAVSFAVRTDPPGPDARWDGTQPVVAAPNGAGYKRLVQEYNAFRDCFPLFACFPSVIPNDEVVSLKMFHREDEPLKRLLLDAAQTRQLDRLWEEHRFISRQPVAENNYLPLFIGFVTQDQPKTMVAYFEGQRPAFKQRADLFLKEEQEAAPKQMQTLLAFAAKAYRRPLREKETAELRDLYAGLRSKGVSHEEAFRGVLARILVAPAFLFRIEQAPEGRQPAPVNDWELATRLSYFLWASAPDEELRKLAASGRLHDPNVLAAQTRRMLKDERVRALAEEFGAQWIHVRGFDALNEKNEKLFPTFDAGLRGAIYEETLLFFQDLFQSDRPVTNLLNADYTFLNETLAKHYAIPGVTGPQWRRVEGVQKYGRGGLLGLASVQTKESGASRTSPVLRGNWIVETLLGEKLPRPPANVPKLPEEEGGDGLTLRQQVERHTRVPECAVCHRRIDPFGFALERYDPIGRFRQKDLGGLPVDAKAKLRDGTEFEGIEGLRTYLMTRKKDVVVRLFCRRLLGYALGRSVAPSDQPLIDSMVSALNRNDGRLSAAVQTIVQSRPFRMIRAREFAAGR